MKNFALTGVAGYIAPRHLQAIHDTGNRLVAVVDPHDSVGVLDRHFPDARYFREFERFDRHLEKLRRLENERVDYISICSPNYLHDAHIRFALRIGAHVICEKPLVIHARNLDALQQLEAESAGKVNVVLQLRLHPALIAVKSRYAAQSQRKHDVVLTYITPRGRWYLHSWKGDTERSGGLCTNIGVHFFDLLYWIFGRVQSVQVHLSEPSVAAGFFETERANVRWFLSVDGRHRDLIQPENKGGPFRSIQIDGQEVEFSEGFTDLHRSVYEEVLAGRGFGIEDARSAVELTDSIRHANPQQDFEYAHPLVRQLLHKGK